MKYTNEELLEQAKKTVEETQNFSISHLQRKLQIGYTRASELMNTIRGYCPISIDEIDLEELEKKNIAVVGVGTAGQNIVTEIEQDRISDIKTLSIESSITDEQIKTILQKTDILFLITGLGGETGGKLISIVAKRAQELKILVVSIVTKPFSFEGQKITKRAEESLIELKKYTDSVFVIQNDNFLAILDNSLGLKESFKVIDKFISEKILNIFELSFSSSTDTIYLDSKDIQEIFGCKGVAAFGTTKCSGENSVCNAIKQAINFPLFNDVNILDAMNMLIAIKTHPNFALMDIEKVMSMFDDNEDISIIFSTLSDPSMREDEVKVTVVATGFAKILNKAVSNVRYK